MLSIETPIFTKRVLKILKMTNTVNYSTIWENSLIPGISSRAAMDSGSCDGVSREDVNREEQGSFTTGRPLGGQF
jgi:hypothetical protein